MSQSRSSSEVPPPRPPEAGESAARSPLGSRWPLLAAVLLFAFLVYCDTLNFQFVHDDRTVIVENPFLRLWGYVPRYFSEGFWPFRTAQNPDTVYRPLVLLWMRVNYVLFGLKPWGWHLTSVLCHVGVTLFVYRLALKILHDWRGALIAAAIFGLHPVHFEAVAWVSGVPEPLAALLVIPAFLCYLESRNRTAHLNHWLLLSLLLYTSAMFVKETALTLPLIIFATEWILSGSSAGSRFDGWIRRGWKGLRTTLPYLLLTAGYVVIRISALGGFQHAQANLPFQNTLLTWPSLLFFYLKLLVWPFGLSPFYDVGYVTQPNLRLVWLPALLILLVAGGLWWWARRSRAAALAVAWLLLPLLPVLDIQVFGNKNFAHNRYLYLPSVGFALLAAFAIRRVRLGRAEVFGLPTAQSAVVLALAILLGIGTVTQDRYYASDRAFYSFAYAASGKNSDEMGTDLANVLAQEGDYEAAGNIYKEILSRNPNSWITNYNLGYMDYKLERLEEAELYLTRAVRLHTRAPDCFLYLGLIKLKAGRLGEAESDLRSAVAIAPEVANYHFVLGMILRAEGKLGAALEQFRAELALDPKHTAAREQIREIQGLTEGR